MKNVYTNMQSLVKEARNIKSYKSLAVFKPARIINFHIRKVELAANYQQRKSFLKKKMSNILTRKLAENIPYTFHYSFVDEKNKRSCLQIIDWEIYQLCRKLIRKYGRKRDLIYKHIHRKYFNELAKERDIHLFLGTNKYWHIRRSKNSFMIIGVFYPPKD